MPVGEGSGQSITSVSFFVKRDRVWNVLCSCFMCLLGAGGGRGVSERVSERAFRNTQAAICAWKDKFLVSMRQRYL